MRRLFRWMFSGLRLLSLLACMGTAWLWWDAGRVYADYAEAGAGGVFVVASSDRSDLSAIFIGRWPGPAALRLSSVSSRDEVMSFAGVVMWPEPAGRRARGWQGVEIASGLVQVAVRSDGSPAVGEYRLRLTHDVDRGVTIWRRYWAVSGLRHGWVVAITSVPPLLWLALRSRRFYVLRRRRLLGLCLRCGYDLTGNTSGRCSECGEPSVVASVSGAV